MFKQAYIFLKNIYNFNQYFVINFSKNVSTAPIIKNAKGVLLNFARNFFISFTIRPKYSNQINYISENNKNIGIIIQGTVSDQKNFLLETLKIYKKIFKNSYIVVSTWKNEKKHKNELKKICDHVIFNEIPNKSGVANVNYQTTSTYNALVHLKKKKIRFALKSRTDTRIYNPNSLIFLKNLLFQFPIKKKYSSNLKFRVLASSNFSCKYKIYGITDILLFSSTEVLIKYFDRECFFEGIKKIGINRKKLLKKDTYVVAESYLCGAFLNRINVKINWSMKHWEKMLKEIFCIFDASSVDFYWNKYEKIFEQRRGKNYSHHVNREISFSDWLSIYRSKDYKLNPKFQEKWKLLNGKVTKSSYF